MKDIFNCLIQDLIFTADLAKDSSNFLVKHKKFRIAEHSLRVAQKPKTLAGQYGADESLAAFTYLKYLWDDNSKLKVIHPWLTAAYKELKKELGGIKCLS